MNSKKFNLYWNLAIFVLLIGLMVVASFYDLTIAKSVASDEAKFFPMLGEAIGKIPGYLIMAFAFVILFTGARRKKKNPLNILFMLVYAAGSVLAMLFLFLPAANLYFVASWGYLLAGLVGAIMTGVLIYMFKDIDEALLQRLKKWCLAAIVYILAVIAVVALFKFVWGRPRFIDLTNDAQFRPWYSFRPGFGDSFPSGHTALAACAFFLAPLSMILSENRRWYVLSQVAAIAYVVLIAASRMVAGDHFLSDVTASVIIALCGSMIIQRIAFGKNFDHFEFGEENIFKLL